MIHEWPDQGKRVPKAETTVSALNKAAKEKFFLTEIQIKLNIDKKSKNIRIQLKVKIRQHEFYSFHDFFSDNSGYSK